MSRIITYQMCGMVLDALYHNAKKDPKDQKSIVKIAQDCNISRSTVNALRDILINLKILIKEGTSRAQRIYWHPDKCGLNDAMLRNVFNIYVGDRKTKCVKRAKPVEKSIVHEDKMSIETAILFLVEQGYTGIITRQPNIYTVETIDLGKIK